MLSAIVKTYALFIHIFHADNQFYIYRGHYLNNEIFTSADQIKVGDRVVVKGKLLNYHGVTPEIAQGNYIYSLDREANE